MALDRRRTTVTVWSQAPYVKLSNLGSQHRPGLRNMRIKALHRRPRTPRAQYCHTASPHRSQSFCLQGLEIRGLFPWKQGWPEGLPGLASPCGPTQVTLEAILHTSPRLGTMVALSAVRPASWCHCCLCGGAFQVGGSFLWIRVSPQRMRNTPPHHRTSWHSPYST